MKRLLQIEVSTFQAPRRQRRLAAGIGRALQLSGATVRIGRAETTLTTKGATCCLQWFTISSRAIRSVTLRVTMRRAGYGQHYQLTMRNA